MAVRYRRIAAFAAAWRSFKLNRTLAIIGGGVAGLMSCQQALACGEFAHVLWFRADPSSLGTAFDTRCAAHLLNVPAQMMGLDPAIPDGFIHWLAQQFPGRWLPDDFVPRMEFARYVQAHINRLDARAQQIHMRVDRAEKTAAGWQISAANQRFDADAMLLAPGFPLALTPKITGVFEAWHWFRHIADPIKLAQFAGPILLVGSGLTAVDIVLGLRAYGFVGQIDVCSNSGRWPLPHAKTEALSESAIASLLADLRACTRPAAVLATLRQIAKHLPWRAALDSLRPHTNQLWEAWPDAIRKTLVTRAFSIWSQHRHRAPPQTLASVQSDPRVVLRKARVKIHAGKVEVSGTPQPRGQLTLFCLGARFCEGIGADPLLDQLREAGHLQQNALGMGLLAAPTIRLALIGARRFGELLETVAVPELRQQAQSAIADLAQVHWTQ